MSPRKSPLASALYRALVEEGHQAPLILLSDVAFTDADITWSELTVHETEVFGIDPSLHIALLWAYVRYTDMTGETDMYFSEYREDERAAYSEYFIEEAQESMDAAAKFMAVACQLPYDQTMAWMCRRYLQLMRGDLIANCWSAPAWAYGEVAATASPGENGDPHNP